MSQRKKILTTAVYLIAFMLATGLFGWFFIKGSQPPESPGTASSHAVPQETTAVSPAAVAVTGVPTTEPPGDTEPPEAAESPKDTKMSGDTKPPENTEAPPSPGEQSGGQVMTLCGKKLEIPIKLEGLVEQGFTYAAAPEEGDGGLRMLDVYYQGKRVSVMVMDRAEMIREIEIYNFLDGFAQFSVDGVTGQSARSAIEGKWGEGQETSRGVEYAGNDQGESGVIVGYDGEDKMKYIHVRSDGVPEDQAVTGEESGETGSAVTDGATDYAGITQGDASAHLEEVLKHVTIAGKPVSFPLTLQDLLDQGFAYESTNPLSRKEKDWSFVLVHQGRRLMNVSTHSGKKGAGPEKRRIVSLQIDYGESGMEDFNLCGVNRDSGRGEVLKIWGQGESTPWGLRYQSGTDKKKVVDMYFSREGKLSSVYISVN